MNRSELQSLAKEVANINWGAIQSDDLNHNMALWGEQGEDFPCTMNSLMALPQQTAIRLLLRVIEAQQLTANYGREFASHDLLEFEYGLDSLIVDEPEYDLAKGHDNYGLDEPVEGDYHNSPEENPEC